MIELIALDVDGVLTDGSINIDQSGELYKSFNVKDGLGIAHWKRDYGDVAFITARQSEILERRAKELGVETVLQDVEDKESALRSLINERDITAEEVVYVGDDLSDLDALELAGISAAPADAVPEVRAVADIVTDASGGEGAVRELIDRLQLSEKGVVGVIPARYGSTRFPGKPLANIAGKPMIQRVYERAERAETLDDILVATDDERILNTVEEFGGTAVMTESEHESGTDRVREVAQNRTAEIIVNIQGDEPLLDPTVIDALVEAISESVVPVATPVTELDTETALDDENTVKVVIDDSGRALYFSRSPIPSGAEQGDAWKHIGLYAFTRDMLLKYTQLESSLERQEDLEQLRLLENGYDVQTVSVDYEGVDVNTPEDIQRVEEYLHEDDEI